MAGWRLGRVWGPTAADRPPEPGHHGGQPCCHRARWFDLVRTILLELLPSGLALFWAWRTRRTAWAWRACRAPWCRWVTPHPTVSPSGLSI